MTADPMRICIECRFRGNGVTGGIGQVAVGLARGLSSLSGEDRYVFLATKDVGAVLERHIAGPCRLHVVEEAPASRWRDLARKVVSDGPAAPVLRPLWHAVGGMMPVSLPRSDGMVEELGADLVHFIHQGAFLTDIPSIYHPHDLQHLHLPEFFRRRDLRLRGKRYKAFCDQARAVSVISTWTAKDVAEKLAIPADKVAIVPLAPPSSAYDSADADTIARMRATVGFHRFIFFPAQTWPHKNHLNLLKALRLLRDRGIVVPLVCSGFQNSFFPTIRAAVESLGLEAQVLFLGFVDEQEMHWLFDACSFVAMPTRFEAASGPVWEAFAAGKPVAASTVTSLPEQVGDAGLLFECDDISAMADAIGTLWQDQALADELGRRGALQVSKFTWERTALHFRALYRQILQRPLTSDDEAILTAPPLL